MIELVIDQRRKSIGAFEVGRVLPAAPRRMVGPFIFLDHMGPVELAKGLPKAADVRPHPHIGLATLTYLYDGEIMHRDSLAVTQAIREGEVNWMVAGSGVTHSERFEKGRAAGDHLHGLQAWIALPVEHEDTSPSFTHHAKVDLPYYENGGLRARLIAGKAFGATSPVPTHSPLFYVDWRLKAGTKAALQPEYPERAAYIVSGSVEVLNQRFHAGQLIVFAPGDTITFEALEDSIVALLGGEPIGERFIEWNFVASSRERIEAAKADWRAGRMKLPDADNQEFIPLP